MLHPHAPECTPYAAPTSLSCCQLPINGEVYHLRDLCTSSNPYARTTAWMLSVTRQSDGAHIASYKVICAATKTGRRLNAVGFAAWSEWKDCYAALLVDAVRKTQKEVAA